MSKSQEKALKIATAISTAILTFGIAYGTMKTQMSATIDQCEKNTDDICGLREHMIEQRTDIKWIRQALEDR